MFPEGEREHNNNTDMNPLYILFFFIAVVSVWFCKFVQVRRQRQIEASAENRARAWDRLLRCARTRILNQRKRDRRSMILDSVIHKKVISEEESKREELTLLPHKEHLSQNSLHTLQSLDEEEGATETMAVEELEKMQMDVEVADSQSQSQSQSYSQSLPLSSWRTKSTSNTKEISGCECTSSSQQQQTSSSSPLRSPIEIVCPICIDTIQAGDNICWSKNKSCHHVYHLHCMIEWLMDNEECPMCRENFLYNDIHDNDYDDDDVDDDRLG